tara:strand:+ start:19 stop:843 length:825 start_codon:yes stop_codon:yes gene_type:complete
MPGHYGSAHTGKTSSSSGGGYQNVHQTGAITQTPGRTKWSPGVGGTQHIPTTKKKRTVTTGGASPFAYTRPNYLTKNTTSGITGSDKFRKFLSRFNPLKKDLIEYFYPSEHGDKYIGLQTGEIPTENYHRDVTSDYWQNVSKNWGEIHPALGAMVNVGAPAGTMIGGLMYDTGQGLSRYKEDPNKYLSPFMQDVKATQFEPSVVEALGSRGVTDISGVDLIGSANAISAENPISSNLQRMAGSVEPLLTSWGIGNNVNYGKGGIIDLYRYGGFI